MKKQESGRRVGAKFMFGSMVVGMVAVGCTTPQSVGIRIGEPRHPVVHKQPGPPSHAPAHGYRKKFAYQYYPTANVYYEPTRNVYFYLSDGTWVMAVSLPSSIQLDMGESVTLELETNRPYVENATHIRQVQYKRKGPPQKGLKWQR
jgi:hypothetical protein